MPSGAAAAVTSMELQLTDSNMPDWPMPPLILLSMLLLRRKSQLRRSDRRSDRRPLAPVARRMLTSSLPSPCESPSWEVEVFST